MSDFVRFRKKRSLLASIGAATCFLAACGGGSEPAASLKTTVPRPVLKVATVSGGNGVAVHMYQALYGKAPSNAMLMDYAAQAAADPSAFAKNLESIFANTSHAALAKQVLDNLGVTAATVPAVNSSGQSEYAILLDAVQTIFSVYPTMRGQVILNMTNLLAGLEADGTYGAAALGYNNQAAVNLTYSSNTANTIPAVVSTSTPTGSGNECAPLLAKAGDSLTYTMTTSTGSGSSNIKYDYSGATYLGKTALKLTVTTTVNGAATSGSTYLDPATGGYLGADAVTPGTSTVITYDPPNYQDLINNAVYTVGNVATVAVKVRESGKSITDAFAAIGGGTALTMDYTFSIERKPNETLTVPAGTYANTCKLKINVAVTNVKLEGNDGSSPLYSAYFGTLAGAFNQPFETNTWLTNTLPNVPKFYVDASSSFGNVTSTQELTAVTLAPR